MLFDEIIEKYKSFPAVRAIALGGSVSANIDDNSSDVDVYVFVDEDIPIAQRESFIKKISSKYEVGAEYFGAGDEFFCDKANTVFDIMYWQTKWFEDVVDNVWVKHYPSNGYTTAFLYTLKICKIVYDRNNWLSNLKSKINTNYPEELKQNIIKRNKMLLKDKPFASYYEQIEKAINRNDVVSVNHRIAAFLASYFDIIFAANELLHPGEKRLIRYAKNNCKILPADFEENINNLLVYPNSNILNILNSMVKNLKSCIDS